MIDASPLPPPPGETLPDRPKLIFGKRETAALDSLSRHQLTMIIKDLIACVPGPLPPSLSAILSAAPRVIQSQRGSVASVVCGGEEVEVVDFCPSVPKVGGKSRVTRKSTLTERLHRHPPESLPPAPPTPPLIDIPELSCAVSELSSRSDRRPSGHAHAFSSYRNSTASRSSCSEFNFDLDNGVNFGSLPISEFMEQAAACSLQHPLSDTHHHTHEHHRHFSCSKELPQIEMYINDNLEHPTYARYLPSIYASEMPTSSPNSCNTLSETNSKCLGESIPILIIGTAGYSEDECEVFMRARCLRTNLTGICRLSQVIPACDMNGGAESGSECGKSHNTRCLNIALARLWKLHPL